MFTLGWTLVSTYLRDSPWSVNVALHDFDVELGEDALQASVLGNEPKVPVRILF